MNFELHNGDCLEIMRGMADNSVDSIVTDPPYGLSFMDKKWDYDVPSTEIWAECLRVLKPGGHLLAFAGTRTQHRMAVRIEDAGFEIRDMIAWVYGNGFPKSLDVSKAIDKAAGAEREVVGFRPPSGSGVAGTSAPDASGSHIWTGALTSREPVTDAARQWQGWGTALKPALEPITVARKPLVGTVAANVLAHGTGGLNIDGCRVAGESTQRTNRAEMGYHGGNLADEYQTGSEAGRWPANLIHDGSEDVVSAFPDASGQHSDVKENGRARPPSGLFTDLAASNAHTARIEENKNASRFFYCAKASRTDRNEGLICPEPQFSRGTTMDGVEITDNTHPTVKPTNLMRYLCRLVTPPGGLVLDPFMGSGSTGKAAVLEGFRFVGCEMSSEYIQIAKLRIEHVVPDEYVVVAANTSNQAPRQDLSDLFV